MRLRENHETQTTVDSGSLMETHETHRDGWGLIRLEKTAGDS